MLGVFQRQAGAAGYTLRGSSATRNWMFTLSVKRWAIPRRSDPPPASQMPSLNITVLAVPRSMASSCLKNGIFIWHKNGRPGATSYA